MKNLPGSDSYQQFPVYTYLSFSRAMSARWYTRRTSVAALSCMLNLGKNLEICSGTSGPITLPSASVSDAIHSVIRQGAAESIIYKGFENLGVQAIGNDGKSARVLTVLDARIIGAATDYGYLFDKDASLLNYESAQYKFSARTTTNSLYSGDDYNYVTAKIANMYFIPK